MSFDSGFENPFMPGPVVFPQAEILFSPPAPSRAAMIRMLNRHGWIVHISFDDVLPMAHITGPWTGTCNVPLPMQPFEDHSCALRDVYDVMGRVICHVHGVHGRT